MTLTDEERSILERRLGTADVELEPLPHVAGDKMHRLCARLVVGDWSKEFVVISPHWLDVTGEALTGALQMLAFGFKDAAPHLLPIRA